MSFPVYLSSTSLLCGQGKLCRMQKGKVTTALTELHLHWGHKELWKGIIHLFLIIYGIQPLTAATWGHFTQWRTFQRNHYLSPYFPHSLLSPNMWERDMRERHEDRAHLHFDILQSCVTCQTNWYRQKLVIKDFKNMEINNVLDLSHTASQRNTLPFI